MKYEKTTIGEWVDFSGHMQPITLLGLTKREVFAAAVLVGLSSQDSWGWDSDPIRAMKAVALADALILALNAPKDRPEGPTS